MKTITRIINALHKSPAGEKDSIVWHWKDSLAIILLMNVLQLILCIL